LTASLSEEVVTRYLELAYEVREKELARRREMERMKAAIRRQKQAEAADRFAAICAALGIELPKPERRPGSGKKKKRKKSRSKGKESRPAATATTTAATAAATATAAGDLAAPAGVPGLHEGSRTDPGVAGTTCPAGVSAGDTEPATREEGASGDDPARPADKSHPNLSRKAKPITREDILKLAVADHLGYLGKVREDGWGGLTCAESGRVGGMMTRRMKRLEKGLPPF